MNLERLLATFSVIADDHHVIAGVRKLLMGLAITGHFATPDGQSLLTQLAKQRASSNESVTKPAAVPSDQLPAFLHSSDAPFVHLHTVARLEKGLTGIKSALAGPYPLVVTAEGRASCDHYDFAEPAAIIPMVSSTGHGKASINRLHYQEGKFAVGSILCAVIPRAPELVSARFLYEYLSAFKDELLVPQMLGTANVSLSVGKIGVVPVPLIAPQAQHQVDELMALCDQLASAQAERERCRERLTLASVRRLAGHTGGTAGFQRAVRFHLDHLADLHARPDQVSALRGTILQIAVGGCLTRQDPSDQPASALLEGIRGERERLIREGLLKQARVAAKEGGVLASVAMPPGWALSTLGEVASKITDGTHKTPTYVSQGIPFISIKDFSAGQLDFSATRFITPEEHSRLRQRCDPRRGDLLLGRIGTLGKAVLVDTDRAFSLFVSVALIRFSHTFIVPEYLCLYLNSPGAAKEFDRIKVGGGTHTDKLNLGDLQTVTVSLPPLAEQRRIVAKVDALMVACDKWEQSLTALRTGRARLLESMVAETLADPIGTDIGAAVGDAQERKRQQRLLLEAEA